MQKRIFVTSVAHVADDRNHGCGGHLQPLRNQSQAARCDKNVQLSLARALTLEQQCLLLGQLADAEYEALEDAERLERSAKVERTAADLDEAAASAARADAERIRRQRLDAERALAATEEAAAKREANVLTQAAREARAVAADAGRSAPFCARQSDATNAHKTTRGQEVLEPVTTLRRSG